MPGDAAPRMGRRPGHVLHTLSQGFAERTWFDALLISGFSPMRRRTAPSSNARSLNLPELPLDPQHWESIVDRLQLSPRLAQVAELTLRGAGDKEIAAALGIQSTTLRTYRERIAARTGTQNRMDFAMRVLAISREIDREACPPS